MDLDRRSFLKLAGLTVSASALPFGFASAQDKKAKAKGAYKTKHVILVAFAGGVRSKETIGTPENIPNLKKMAAQGVILPHVATKPTLGHFFACMSIFTGQVEEKGKDIERVGSPTVFEYARKQLSLEAKDVWLSTSGAEWEPNYAYGTHPDYGSKYGAQLVGSGGVFNSQWQGVIDRFGRPRPDEAREREKVDELRKAMDEEALQKRVPSDGFSSLSADARSTVEKAVIDELSGSTTNATGPSKGDAMAIRAAKGVLCAHHPVLLGIALSNADVGHGSYASYTDVVRRNDLELGALWSFVQADPELKGTTTMFVLPEFGRDKDVNQRQALAHDDASSRDVNEVACFAIGPDFRQGATVTDEVRWTQICPTVCELLGCSADKTKEKPIRAIFAS